ncbi:DUF6456 domain-containing protein [Hyphomicrobium sp.]|uniref:DUF6456 domain-containing protein n=1 Tax=Hyphomicrobium sp. TaxID=82 RepID=UPI003F72100F
MTKASSSRGGAPSRAPARSARTVKQRRARATPGQPTRNPAESPIAWLYSRRDSAGNPLITEAQFNAGERLRQDFSFAQMSPSITQSWSVAGGGGTGRRGAPGAGVELADRVIAAGDRVRRALDAVGPELSGILLDVCCFLKGLEDAERKARWPQRSGKIVLGMALSALARHYGFSRPPDTPGRAARVRHWGADGYRPGIDADDANEETNND